jgi:hypothetical protein
MFKYIGVYCIVWLAYLELSPRLGNIWLRRDAEGVQRISIGSLKALLAAPWYTTELWWPSYWDVNPWPVLALIVLLWGMANQLPVSHLHLREDDKMSL